MRAFLIIFSVADVLVCGWMLLQFPIMKVKTEPALNSIERIYLRRDLTPEEAGSFRFFKDWILSNQQITSAMLGNVKVAGIALGTALLFQNLFILSLLNKKQETAEQGGSGQPTTRSQAKSEGSDKPQPE